MLPVLQFLMQIVDYLTVEQIDDTMSIGGIVLRVGDHDDGGAFDIQMAKQLHYFKAIFGVESARTLHLTQRHPFTLLFGVADRHGQQSEC